MAKKYIQKALSVGLSLTLCAGLVVPSFAASFEDLQHAFNGNGAHEGITVTDNEDGSRTITLEDEVTRTGSEGSVAIHESHGSVILDLNGHTVDGNAAEEKTGTIFKMDGGTLVIQDNSTERRGTITGGSNTSRNGGGILVSGGSLTLEGGAITGNTASASGGGVSVERNGTFIMKGGEISGNTANGSSDSGGGGVHVYAGGQFTMEGGVISGNDTPNGAVGGGVAVHRDASFTMNGGEIRDNASENGDGVQVDCSSFTMTGGTITGTTTVADNGANGISITGGTFSSLNEKYLDDGHGLLSNGNGTYDVVEHGGSNHTFANGVCQVVGCDAQAPVTKTPVAPATPDAPVDGPEIGIDDPVIDIDDPAVPLAAGPVTCGEFIDYLWRHEGEPEADIVVDHEYAPAISWALSIGIISDDSFEPDELVTVAAVQDILANYAQYLDVAMPELTTLTGEEDEAVLNCDEVLAEFFGEERSE